jgi:hypothetical protein
VQQFLLGDETVLAETVLAWLLEETMWTSPLQLMQMVKSADSFDLHQQN